MIRAHRLSHLSIILAGFLAGALASRATADEVGKPFPTFTATDAISGERISLEDFRGKVVLVDFWATWCGPCVKELPNVKRAYRDFHHKGLEIISISLDRDERKFKSFVRSRKMNWHHVLGGGLARKYGVNSIPRMFVIDPEGICVSASARGPALKRAIKTALERMPAQDPRSSGAGGPSSNVPSPRTPTILPVRVSPELEAARAEAQALRSVIESGAEPYHAIEERLEEIADELDAAEKQMPIPRDPRATARAFGRALDDLAAVRREMFICGVIETAIPPVPDNPFTEGTIEPRAVAGAVRPRIAPARATTASLADALATTTHGVHATLADLHAAEASTDQAAVEAACADAKIFAASLDSTFAQPWKARLATLDAMLESRLGEDDASTAGSLDDSRQRVHACRDLLLSAARSPSAASQLRDRMAALCGDLVSLAEAAVANGALESLPPDMPANPLEEGRSVDVRARVEASRQLDRAEALITALESGRSASTDRTRVMIERVKQLQGELDACGGDSTREATVHASFVVLCDELLSVADGG